MPSGKEPDLYRSTMLLLSAAIIILVTFDALHQMDQGGHRPAVAIIDPLSPDAWGEFTSSCTRRFQSVGYGVDVMAGPSVSVDFLKTLKRDYRVIIFRVHSGVFEDSVWFFTGEEYSQGRYVLEQLVDEVHPARPTLGSEFLFAVGAEFVLHFLEDRFDGALVVVMGCDGLSSQDLAKAFLDAGADAYVSWDGPVSLRHTDEATLTMLRALVEDGKSLGDAVEHSMELVGPDPSHSSVLRLFPEGGAAFSVSR